MSPSVADYLLCGTLKLQPALEELEQLDEVHRWISSMVNSLPNTHRKEKRLLHQQLKLAHDEIQYQQDRAKGLDYLTRQGENRGAPRREKRFIGMALGGLALLGAGIGNFAYSGYINERLNVAEERADDMLHYIDLTAQKVITNSRRLNKLNDTLYALALHEIKVEKRVQAELNGTRIIQRLLMLLDTCESALSHVARMLDRATTVWNMAIQGHVTPELIDPVTAAEELRRIKSSLHNRQVLAVDQEDLTAFYRLPCHLAPRGDSFVTVIPIPIYDAEDMYQVFRHLRVPIAADQHLEMFVDTDGLYLATNRERTLHQEMTTAELQSCLHTRRTYLCPQARPFRKSTEPGCLFSLLRGEKQQARRSCVHLFRTLRSTDIIQLAADQFLVTTSQKDRAERICKDANLDQTIDLEEGSTEVRLPEGCALSTEGMYVGPAYNQTLGSSTFVVRSGPPVELNLTEIMQDLYPHLDLEVGEISKIVEGLSDRGGMVSLPDILAARQQAHSKKRSPLGIVSMVLTGLGLLITATFFLWVCIRWRRNNRDKGEVEKKGKTEGQEPCCKSCGGHGHQRSRDRTQKVKDTEAEDSHDPREGLL